MKGLFVTGTDTNVGKTWVGSQLIAELIKQKVKVRPRKPIESGWPSTEDISDTDAWKLAHAKGQKDNLDLVCANRFSAALSPDRAAMLEGETISLEKLKQDCLKELNDSDFLYVEGAGGLYSPIATDGLNADLAVSLQLPILLVVEDRLGCINQTLLNVEAITKQKLNLVAIALNQSSKETDDQAMDNLADIKQRVDCEVIAFRFNQKTRDSIEQLAKIVIAAQ